MPKKRTKQELINASEHVCYEIWMLDQVGRALAYGLTGIEPLHNALINSFAIHARNLIDFLYKAKAEVKSDMIIAEHYFSDPEKWKTIRSEKTNDLKHAKIRCDKQVAHLTYTRQRKENWNFAAIAREIFALISVFLDNIDHGLLGEHCQSIYYIFPEKFDSRK